MTEERVSLAELLNLTLYQFQERIKDIKCKDLVRMGMLAKTEMTRLKRLSEKTRYTEPALSYDAFGKFRVAEIVFRSINKEITERCSPVDLVDIFLLKEEEAEMMR